MKHENPLIHPQTQITGMNITKASNAFPVLLTKTIVDPDAASDASIKAALSSLESVIRRIPGVAIQRIDRNGRIRSWNQASETLYGYPKKFALGKRFEELLLADTARPEFNTALQQAWQTGGISPTACWPLRSARKETLWVNGAFMPYCIDGTPQDLFAVQIDATPYHQSETLLIQYKDQLEAQVRQRTEELSRSNKKLHQEILNRSRSEKKLLAAKETLEKTVARRTARLNDAMRSLTQKHQELIHYKNRLEALNEELLETNKAISVLARNMEKRKETAEGKTIKTISEKIMPSIEGLLRAEKDPAKRAELEGVATHLRKIGATVVANSSALVALSSVELKVAHMVKNGFTSNEIARQLFLSLATIKSHRRNIRKKLRINNTDINLESYLLSELGSDR